MHLPSLVWLRRATRVWLGFGVGGSSLSADVITDCNEALCAYSSSLPPPGLSRSIELRAFALAHLAIFEAVKSATAGERTQAEAAAAQAAHDMIVRVFPGAAATFDPLLAKQLITFGERSAVATGVKLGSAAAAKIFEQRVNDGVAEAEGPYAVELKPGSYRFTPPFDAPPFNGFAAGPKWGRVTPFVLKSGDQFRAPPPAALNDALYAFDLNEIKLLGGKTSAARTREQTDIARFWDQNAPPVWNEIARVLALRHPGSLLDHARLFATLNLAMADASIAVFDSKYAHRFWRPYTAIRLAQDDGNEFTTADSGWEPLIATPPHPEYPAAHASVSAAAATVLIWFFHGDEHTFTLNSTMMAKFSELQPRTFHRLSAAAEETAMSRLYGGIHFRTSCLAGLAQGRQIGAWVVEHAPCAAGK